MRDADDTVIVDRLIEAMCETFGADAPRISHAMAVLRYADELLESEEGASLVVRAAAVLHDIGIHEAERRHGSPAGRYQEIEGPPIAREIMKAAGLDENVIDHVCRIVANHHSARDIDTPEFRILWDADWLVNIPEEFAGQSRDKLAGIVEKTMKTGAGRRKGLDVIRAMTAGERPVR